MKQISQSSRNGFLELTHSTEAKLGIEKFNKPITILEFKAVSKSPISKSPGLENFTSEFYQTFRDKFMPTKIIPKI